MRNTLLHYIILYTRIYRQVPAEVCLVNFHTHTHTHMSEHTYKYSCYDNHDEILRVWYARVFRCRRQRTAPAILNFQVIGKGWSNIRIQGRRRRSLYSYIYGCSSKYYVGGASCSTPWVRLSYSFQIQICMCVE